MSQLTLFSPAKLNLFLHITGRADNGYHHLQSVFTAIDFGDTLSFRTSTSQKLVTLIGADELTDDINDNLIVKAVETLAKRYPAYASSVQIILEKHIPTGAGLGGGSSNCATTLIAINELWGLRLSADELIKIGASLGADVPFFIFAHFHKTSAIATGIGEILTAIDLPDCGYLVLLPDEHVSTATLFGCDELKRDCPVYSHHALSGANFFGDNALFTNVFTPLVLARSAKVAHAFGYLCDLEHEIGTKARMSGTGSAVFLPLPYELNDTAINRLIDNAPCPALFARGLY
ncbi:MULTISPECIES: 4-(cytidine 5'-diphospho)-2-C-methyl-D-erythritol kinase [Moraxella]|uniref:4-diphosphocytidyl-2-C-methyl-D-erythritol kinase n=1 Tax=Moraxella lacunata TaxID=477 RepID=A0A1B8Q4T2_MORLA|nr:MULTISPECIES: 4-(cytidine 5'-diphospho)-2-C-methyl-D-erythritol kinase [Moraxella]MBE9578413.1 4-(cytidine 5'-diphospho)-2-C-methyl-D-erythritol kinase [Moraxella sp. K1664]MBE9587777.1 4-(cytidine 5'-diphospho)-2-C-methyl-D-erythritol kinase [Moraxella sp. K1630]MBE9590944.1 4-(cytidine 5'-diphospho)-2-C-methyl-D-erythritol kinase [Moraxella sp. K127]MBE9596882.1 4-(cytidine 5'-diphospho)-2-C-methyl-D-erythritol kinase [Moraxella sp. K2450]MDH9218292.1 4-(cytidine 5'-diphospho)-2-C-methyl-